MPGLKNLLNGVLRFRATVRKDLVKQFEKVRNNPQPAAIFFTCMDSRILPARFVQAQVGDMFVVRNSANLIPNAVNYENQVTTEPAALELAIKRGGIQHVIVCGHSDCKAINTLYNLHKNPESFDASSPMDNWLRKHGYRSVAKLVRMMEKSKSEDPNERKLQFFAEDPQLLNFTAYIDPNNEFGIEDRLSQINALQQIVHIASHGFIQDYMLKGELYLHVLWFDVYKGDMHMFSRAKERFVLIDENSVDELEAEARGNYANSRVATAQR
ncbi:hypothetical protein M3Y97_00740700 [Aphelenchoides bicaudatus]|nr:hypothetical protein M3Y97_00740700 [Aphelenchoides bicaudatus]